MSTDNLGVALVHTICPICCKKVKDLVVMNSRLTKKNAEKIKKMNGQAIDFDEDACEECTKYKDKVVFFVIIDPDKSTPKDPYRIGKIIGVYKDSDFVKDCSKFILKTKNDVSYCFIEEAAAKSAGLLQEEPN